MSKVYVCATVDWEGEHFDNLNDLKWFRQQLGDGIPITHFICPAYFHRKFRKTSEKIKSAIYQQDEIQLHIHCYKELIKACRVDFKTDYNYYQPHTKYAQKISAKYRFFNYLLPPVSGRGVPLTVYSKKEQEIIIAHCKSLLKEHFPDFPINGYRAGGNMLNDDSVEVLEKLGFDFDSSATCADIYSKGHTMDNKGSGLDDYGDRVGVFAEMVGALWGGQLQLDYPVKNTHYMNSVAEKVQQYDTQPFYLKKLQELPENCGMSDFVSPQKTVMPVFLKLLEKAQITGIPQYLHYGIHHEGTLYYKKQFLKFIMYLKKYKNEVVFLNMNACRKIFFPAD